MARGLIIIGYPTKTSIPYMLITSILGMALGLVMLLYPGGTLALMKVGFKTFQAILTIFVLYFALANAIHEYKNQNIWRGVFYTLVGVCFTVLIWILKIDFLFWFIRTVFHTIYYLKLHFENNEKWNTSDFFYTIFISNT